MSIKKVFLNLLAILFIGLAIEENSWSKPYLSMLADTLDAIVEGVDTDELLNKRAFPHYSRVKIAQEKLLNNPIGHKVYIESEDRAVFQRISEIIYPITVDRQAPLALSLEMSTGKLSVHKNTSKTKALEMKNK